MLCYYQIDGCDVHMFHMPVITSNMYVLIRDRCALIVDPCRSEEAEDLLRRSGILACTILLTHEHYDHISGVNRLRELYPCQVICSKTCAERIGDPKKNQAAFWQSLFIKRDEATKRVIASLGDPEYVCHADRSYSGRMDLQWEGLSITLTETPGHSPGGQVIDVAGKWFFTGDSLIPGVEVITRMPGGSKHDFEQMTQPYLDTIPPEGVIFPGHGHVTTKHPEAASIRQGGPAWTTDRSDPCMIQADASLLNDFYGKDLIAYGTGDMGKLVIPYLAQAPGIRLYGVTNSRLTSEYEGTFLNTGLPMRSLQTWAKLLPNATIFITTIIEANRKEIVQRCRETGFRDVMFIPEPSYLFIEAVSNAHMSRFGTILDKTHAQAAKYAPFASNYFFELMCYANLVRDTHKASFGEFRGCHRGQTVAVVGSGPSLASYTPISGVVHIGVNAVPKREDIKLDYYFTSHQDNFGYSSIDEWSAYLKKCNAVKFFGQYTCDYFRDGMQIPDYIIEENNGRKYFSGLRNRSIYHDLEYFTTMDFDSIIFSAISFAIYVRAKKILLIGCDASANGHFDDKDTSCFSDFVLRSIHEGYRKFKAYMARFYPDVEIVSVNPVGLRGMFHDVYTEDYLDKHPELDRSECELLDPERTANG